MKELGWELFEDFKLGYIRKLAYELSEKHGLSDNLTEMIVRQELDLVEKKYSHKFKDAHKRGFAKVVSAYFLEYFEQDLQDAVIYLENKLGRKATKEEIEELRKELANDVISDPRVIETFFELWAIYYNELYRELEKFLEEVEQRAKQEVLQVKAGEHITPEL